MKLITYNVNGIRAAMKKGLLEWLASENPDIICLQEVKAEEAQADLEALKQAGFHIYWHEAQKKGYSGVAIFTKVKPASVTIGMGVEQVDAEGRVIRLDFAATAQSEAFTLVNTYFPSGTTGDARQDFKYAFLEAYTHYIAQVRQEQPNLLLCGDVNICHKEIDIHNPVSNKNSSGFLPEERLWVSNFLASGFIDTFRHFSQAPHEYTWWTYRAGARERNIGWRIDYFFASAPMESRLRACRHAPEAKHSDHCPVILEII